MTDTAEVKEGQVAGLHGYPRPQLEREHWVSLDGEWDFALDPEARWTLPDQVVWRTRIVVPFSPETPASGINDTGFFRACWYRRTFERPGLAPGERLLLHFGAVDYAATVWVNGTLAVRPRGRLHALLRATSPSFWTPDGPQTIVVRAEDDPQTSPSPAASRTGSSTRTPSGIRAPPASGRPSGWSACPPPGSAHVRWTPNVERWEIGFEARLDGERREDLRLNVKLWAGDQLLADDTYAVVAGEVHRRIALSDPGIDDYRNELLWSPATPTSSTPS